MPSLNSHQHLAPHKLNQIPAPPDHLTIPITITIPITMPTKWSPPPFNNRRSQVPIPSHSRSTPLLYTIVNKPIGAPLNDFDWQQVDRLRIHPGFQHLPHRPPTRQATNPQSQHHTHFGGIYQPPVSKTLPEDDIARICAIANLGPTTRNQLKPIWNRVAAAATKAKKKQLVRHWWLELRQKHPILPEEPTPDINNAVIDLLFASDTQAPKANGLYPAMLLSVSSEENYLQNRLLSNQDKATFVTADDLNKPTGRDFSKFKFSHMKVKDAFHCFWIILLNLFGPNCTVGRQMWQVWHALCSQHRYDDDYERYTHHIGPQLLSACLLKVREQLCICPSVEEFRTGYTPPLVPIDDILTRIRNGQDFRDYDVLDRWFPRPRPKQATSDFL